MAEKHARPVGWIKGEPMTAHPDGWFAVVPLRIWLMDLVPAETATILAFTSAAARDEWLKWWGK